MIPKEAAKVGLTFGGAIMVLGFIVNGLGQGSIGPALILGGIVLAFLPYGLITYFRGREIEDMERNFPKLLKDLSEAKRSGVPLPQAFIKAKDADYGHLTPFIVKVANQLTWDMPFEEVLERFLKRMTDSKLIQRSLIIVLQSHRSGGDIADTMDALSQEAYTIKQSEEERKAVLHQQVLVMHAIFYLFVGILVVLFNILTPLLSLGGEVGVISISSQNLCDIGGANILCSFCPVLGVNSTETSVCYYQSVFFFMILVQGIFTGLVAGVISEGRMSAGMIHILLMVPLGVLAFLLFV